MTKLDKTIGYHPRFHQQQNAQCVTVFDGKREPFTLDLNEQGRDMLRFGRLPENDIVLESSLVSREHGLFVRRGDRWFIRDDGSRNGLTYNDTPIQQRELLDGDIIRIDNGKDKSPQGVLFVTSFAEGRTHWESVGLRAEGITIGRNQDCTITLPHISVSRKHATIFHKDGNWILRDEKSTNGVVVNGKPFIGSVALREKDVISIADAKLIFTESAVYYCSYNAGFTVDAEGIVVKRGKGTKARITTDHVNLTIRPGELITIIGGSGAGKSTLLNCLCGYLPPTSGEVSVNGIDLYHNYQTLKQLIGYVPQSDIVYDNLTVGDTLRYAADLRLPPDTTAQEKSDAIVRALNLVELTDKKDSLVKNLSGGQRKRASIAVELLSDPGLIFMDEPASGLDPGTERSLMHSLRQMTNNGKTIILVTHSTLQLKLADRIVIMGRGGRLCFFGSYDEALRFFGVDDIVDIYALINEQSEVWQQKFAQEQLDSPVSNVGSITTRRRRGGIAQTCVLCARTFKLLVNDRHRLLIILLQAPLLAVLVSLVASGNEFDQSSYSDTKSILFILSCCGFWVGLLNAIQEICKERNILRRETMAGVNTSAYLMSKLIFMVVICAVQSTLLVGLFIVLVGAPTRGLLLPAPIEMNVTIFLTAICASAIGLFVSALVTNADRAMAVAPILLMPQILFSGLAFDLSGITDIISMIIPCRWSISALCTTANLNAIKEGLFPMTFDPLFLYEGSHLLKVWGILLILTLVPLLLIRLSLIRLSREG